MGKKRSAAKSSSNDENQTLISQNFSQLFKELSSLRNEINELKQKTASEPAVFPSMSTSATPTSSEMPSTSSSMSMPHQPIVSPTEEWATEKPKKVLVQNLTTFDGSFLKWNSYSFIMELNVMNNSHLNNVEKLTFINATTTGEANVLVQQLMSQRSNPQLVWKELKDQYGRNEKCEEELRFEAKNFPVVKGKDDLKGLKAAKNKAIWFKTVLLNTPTLVDGMQKSLIFEIANHCYDKLGWQINGKCKNFNDLEKLLSSYYDEADANLCFSKSKKEVKKSLPVNQINESSNTQGASKPLCVFDNAHHFFKDCPVPVQEKFRIAKSKNLCYCCLKSGHATSKCLRKRNCSICKVPHNRVLCFKMNSSSPVTNDSQTISPVASATAEENNPVTPVSSVSPMNPICFKTLVSYCNGEPIRVVFDECAGANFVQADAVKRLNLKTINGITKKFCTFGSATPSFTSNRYCKLYLKSGKETVCVEAIVVPTLGTQDYSSPDNEVIQNAKNLNFYPNDDPNLKVELLLGLTSSKNILGSTQKMNDFVLQHSVLGDLCYGGLSEFSSSSVNSIFEDSNDSCGDNEIDEFTLNFLKNHVKSVDGRIEVQLPWIPPVDLETNFELCKQRLLYTVKRLRKMNMVSEYQNIINEYLSLGIISEVPVIENEGHYLNHHAVIREDKVTTKIRIVFDGSCLGYNQKSLNHFLYKGNVPWDLIKTLTQFRANEFALAGDITKAFLMISVEPEDRKFLKFLWINQCDELIAYQFNRVPFGTSASPFLLFVALAKVFQTDPSTAEIYEEILSHFYVDDFLFSAKTIKEVTDMKNLCSKVLADSGFMLSKFVTNFDEPPAKPMSILGLKWNPVEDTLSIKSVDAGSYNTPRKLSSLIARHFDVLGIIGPYIVELRKILSRTFQSNDSWDQELDESNIKHIEKVLSCIPKDSKINRCLNYEKSTLVMFTDANCSTIGCVFYVVNSSNVQFLFSKSRLKKSKTVPLAELNALTLGCSFLEYFYSIINPSRIILFTDSKINIDRLCINNVNRLKHQIAVRIINLRSIIQKYNIELHHVESENNPADKLTKFYSFEFSSWIYPVIKLPSSPIVINSVNETIAAVFTDDQITEILSYFSNSVSLSSLTPLKFSLEQMIIATQMYHWGNDYLDLLNGKLPSKQSDLGRYRCFIENNLVHVHLRSSMDQTRIFLPSGSHISKLILEHLHSQVYHHTGYMDLYSRFSSTYYVENCKNLSYQLVKKCSICTQLRGKPLKAPMGILPKERLTVPEYAFSRISLDFAGPLKIDKLKCHILVVRCLNSGAVFLKRLTEPTSEAVLLVIAELSALYGKPQFIYSDHASYFEKNFEVDLDCDGKILNNRSIIRIVPLPGGEDVTNKSN